MPKVYKVTVQLANQAQEFQPDINEFRITLWTDTVKQYTQVEYIPVNHMEAIFDQVVAVAIDHIKRRVAKDAA